VKLPDNKNAALRRLHCFEGKLKKNPQLEKIVRDKFSDLIAKEYLQEATEKEVAEFQGRKWFLPVFSVQNPNKPGKVRLVYDAAAKYEGIALNDMLMKGPDNLTPLLGVLLRFRQGKIAICGDIAEMYHRVKISPADQFVQLVLWRDMDMSITPKIMKLCVMSFGATCSPSEAQYVKNTNAMKFQKKYPRAVDAIVNRHYVDDYLDCADTVDEALKIANDVATIHSYGGFLIRNWISNSSSLLEKLVPTGVAEETTLNLDLSDDVAAERVLGMHWNTRNDCFLFKTNFTRIEPAILERRKKPTKREVLSVVMSLFDPYGMLATIVMPAKVLIQNLWRHGCGWDEKIPDELNVSWENWLTALDEVKKVEIPRWFSKMLPKAERIELHIMADASELAFSSVAYLRIESGGEIDVTFVAAKTRVAPQKPLSIPRLELQAAVLACRLSNTLKSELSLNLDRIVFWSDSLTVLGWLRSTQRRYSTFVSHRVGEILDHSNVNDWCWVPSKENVADDATKWTDVPKIPERWFAGPVFLSLPELEWPVEKNKVQSTSEEERATQFHGQQAEIAPQYELIDVRRISKWKKLVRVTAWFFRYCDVLKSRANPVKKSKLVKLSQAETRQAINNAECLNGEELDRSQRYLLMKAQHESFPEEMNALGKQKIISKNSSLYKLGPILVDGMMRVQTRLDAAPSIVEDAMKNPIVLKGCHPVTTLIIESIHREFHHHNRETVVNEMRRKFWVPKIRVFINRVIKSCTLCAYRRAKPIVPKMAPLPRQRLEPFVPPFTNTAIDYAGPFEVAVGRRREKRWIVLFTCLTMRAIHLEVASSLDTSSCVMSIRNFMNRRGVPREMISDNGTNLKSAEKELKELLIDLDWNKVVTETQPIKPGCHSVKWTFIPPAAPHFGGVWERMIRLVKNSLYQVMKARAPKDEFFRSAIIEVESTVNSRPLHYTSTEDVCQPSITPNSLLQLSLSGVSIPEPPDHINSKYQWVVVQQIAHEFWKRWLRDYLPTIATRTKWFDETKPLKVGQLVLLMDSNLKRNEWIKGRIVDVKKSLDGKIRSATVKTARGVLNRPVVKLAFVSNLDDGDNEY
jgi:hypothetical protein